MSEQASNDRANTPAVQQEARQAVRRRTLALVTALDGTLSGANAMALNVSLTGAYIQADSPPPVGSRLTIQLQLPSGARHPLRIGSRVVRTDQHGFGVLFEDLQSRDRALIRGYASFLDLDDAVVALQGSIPHLLTGNLLPICDKGLIDERLRTAADRDVQVLVALSVKRGPLLNARIDYESKIIRLRRLDKPLPDDNSVIYCTIVDGPLQSVFEGLIVERGEQPELMIPDRMYHNDRRCSRRLPAGDLSLRFAAPHDPSGSISMPLTDISEGGCAVLAPKNSLITVGMRFPALEVTAGDRITRHDGATVTRIVPSDLDDYWMVGLNFLEAPVGRDAFERIENRTVSSSLRSSLQRVMSLTRKKLLDLIGPKQAAGRKQVNVCQYKNTRREKVVGILDATFDLQQAHPQVDVAVLIAPPFQVRKEIFNLLARTIVDNFKRDGLNAVVLRFDMSHMVGESHNDPDPEGVDAAYFYNWTYSTFESDMIGSLAFLQRRFQPTKRVMVSFSVAAIPARRMIADNEKPGVDLWVAPFGCPDGQDQFKFLTAGVDLFQKRRDGEHLEPIYIYGRRGDVNGVIGDAIERKMGFLEDARFDMAKITIPVCWILGTYDFVVTRERVRQMLNAPGGGIREIIELPSGHLLRTGPEAIESYKLIYEIVAKHLIHSDRPAIEPDLLQFARQNEAEWARIKRTRIKDTVEFWNTHLFGPSEGTEGYDMFLFNPDYMEMMRTQAGLLGVRPGDRVADLGCGTGNFSTTLLGGLSVNGTPITLTCCDLVPKAVERTREKLQKLVDESDGRLSGLKVECRVVDLEGARLSPIQEFLSGKLYGPVALAGRIEGLETATLRKIAADYGPRLHEILHGALSTAHEVQVLCPALDHVEAETVQEFSRVSRFIKGELRPEDLKPGRASAASAKDLPLEHLFFSGANRECRIDLPSDAFDKIGVSIVLPYLYDPQSAAREFYRVLAPGGVIMLSSPKPNYDSSKSYIEEAQALEQRTDLDEKEKDRLLRSLRELSAFVQHVLEMEDEGRFRFFTPADLTRLMQDAGFANISTVEALGDPPSAVIVRAEKPA